MYMSPQQALAQYYQNQQNRQVGIPQATVQPTFGGLPATGAPGAGAPMGNATSPAGAGMYNRTNMPPQINALAQQMQANQQLQRQIGYNGAPTPQGYGSTPPQGVNIAGQQFGPNGQPMPGMPQPTPMQPGAPVGMASAAPQPMAGNAQQMPQNRMGQWGGGLGGGANSLARYFMR